MKKQQFITKTERVDDIPLLMRQMHKIRLSELIDQHFPAPGNWQGLSIGQVTTGWLSDILSEGDHCLNHVETWAKPLLMTLSTGLGTEVRALDFSDDRLAAVLDYLSRDEQWQRCECQLNGQVLRVYHFKADRVRIDTTTAKSYVNVTEEGWFPFGHRKDHRSDLPQLKISPSALDPLGIPVTTTVVSGNGADDPLYIPEIKRVQAGLKTRGLWYIGDCKMSSLETRAWVSHSGDDYLGPLSAVPVPPAALEQLLEPVWRDEQRLIRIYRPQTEDEMERQEEPTALAEGFVYEEPGQSEVEGQSIQWLEQRLVVRSFKHAERQQPALNARLDQAKAALASLNVRGRGHKILPSHELAAATEKILSQYRVANLLSVTSHTETQTIYQRAYKDRLARTETPSQTAVHSTINPLAYQNAVRCLGWRI